MKRITTNAMTGIAALIAVSFCGPVLAQTATPQTAPSQSGIPDNRLMLGITLDEMQGLVSDLGGTVVSAQMTGNGPMITATIEGVTFTLSGTVCSGGQNSQCRGMLALVNFPSVAVDDSRLLTIAHESPIVKVARDPATPGTAYVSRYDVLDNGQTYANLRLSVQMFVSASQAVARQLYGTAQ